MLLAAGSGDASRAAGPLPAAPQPAAVETAARVHREVLDRYCVTCHNARIVRGEAGAASPLVAQLRAAGLTLDTLDLDEVGERADVWEALVRRLRAGMMPPAGRPRPAPRVLDELAAWLEDRLDAAARRRPNPGRPAAVHRLNRAEYRNAVRDVLAVEVAVEDLLPADDSSHGFDNVGVALRLSESLLERYLAAARRVSRLAVGRPPPGVASDTYRIATDQPQHDRVAALPFGTRGGARITHLFPRDADYEIAVELGRVRGGRTAHPLEVTVDGEQVAVVTAGQPVADDERGVYHEGGTLVVRTPVAAGPRDVGVTFHRRSRALVEQVRDPFRNPRRGGVAGPIPIVSSVTIRGPYGDRGAGDTPSRRRIFVCAPETPADEPACAGEILSRLARRAYRRPATAADVALLRRFYDDARAGGDDFEGGIERALRYLLASPDFLFRFEADPVDAAAGSVHPVSDVELASRLSFFLWSSLPDDELLAAAETGRLGDPAELDRQARRMLADPRSAALTENFAGQWLQLRNLAGEVERRIRRAEQANAETPLPSLDQPTGVPDAFGEHLTLLYDLLALAYQADVTRVSCTQVAREQSGRAYPDIGVPEGHHTISHHQTDAHNVAQYTKVNVYHLSLFARFVEKLRAIPDGDGTLLDHSMLLYGCGMGDGDHHTPFDLPVALVGGGAGRLAGNRHLRYPLHTPFMNLGLALLDKVDVRVDRIADSTGRLAGV